jgi:hypothetical protein
MPTKGEARPPAENPLDQEGAAESGPPTADAEGGSSGPLSSARGFVSRMVGSPGAGKQPQAERSNAETKAIVDGLDRREQLGGFTAAFVQAALAAGLYLYYRTSPNTKVVTTATDILITGIILSVGILLGTLFRRRALLGFALLLAGLEQVNFAGTKVLKAPAGLYLVGVAFLLFGGWLIVRVMKVAKEARLRGERPPSMFGSRRPPPAKSAAPGETKKPSSSGPKASKRYTPPRRKPAASPSGKR